MPLLTLILPSVPFTLGTTDVNLPTPFTPPIRRTRVQKLSKLNPLPTTPCLNPPVLVLLHRRRVCLMSDIMLFTLRTWLVTCEGRNMLRLLTPLSALTNPTGPLIIRCTDSVVLLWSLLLSPASIVLAKLSSLPKTPVAPIVLRFATVLIMKSSLLGMIVCPTLLVRCTSLLLTVRWLVALMTTALQFPFPVLATVRRVIDIGLAVFILTHIGMLTRLFNICSRLTVVGWQALYVISSIWWWRCLARHPLSPLYSAAPLVLPNLVITTTVGPSASRNGIVLLFTSDINLLRISPITTRLGPIDASILAFNVPVPMSLAKSPVIPQRMLVLINV